MRHLQPSHEEIGIVVDGVRNPRGLAVDLKVYSPSRFSPVHQEERRVSRSFLHGCVETEHDLL